MGDYLDTYMRMRRDVCTYTHTHRGEIEVQLYECKVVDEMNFGD